jgi:hypothetical protein
MLCHEMQGPVRSVAESMAKLESTRSPSSSSSGRQTNWHYRTLRREPNGFKRILEWERAMTSRCRAGFRVALGSRGTVREAVTMDGKNCETDKPTVHCEQISHLPLFGRPKVWNPSPFALGVDF